MKLFLQSHRLKRNSLFVDCVAVINKILETPEAVGFFFSAVLKVFLVHSNNAEMLAEESFTSLFNAIKKVGDIPVDVAKIVASAECYRDPGKEKIFVSQNVAFNILGLDEEPTSAKQKGLYFFALFVTLMHECSHILTNTFNIVCGLPLSSGTPPDFGAVILFGNHLADCGYGYELLQYGGMLGHVGDDFSDICLCRVIDSNKEAAGTNLSRRMIPASKAMDYSNALCDWAVNSPVVPCWWCCATAQIVQFPVETLTYAVRYSDLDELNDAAAVAHQLFDFVQSGSSDEPVSTLPAEPVEALSPSSSTGCLTPPRRCVLGLVAMELPNPHSVLQAPTDDPFRKV